MIRAQRRSLYARFINSELERALSELKLSAESVFRCVLEHSHNRQLCQRPIAAISYNFLSAFPKAAANAHRIGSASD